MNNNDPIILPGIPVARGNPEIVKLLTDALDAARAGKLIGLGLVGVYGPDAMSAASTGQFPCTVIAGCNLLARQLLENMTQKPSSLMLPRR